MQIDSVVGLNHQGVPLYSLIHSGILKGKEWDDLTVFVVQDLLYNATQEYIRRNRIPGCTVNTSPKYFHKANVDELSSCAKSALDSPKETYIGGYWQECEYLESYSKAHKNITNGNQCDKLRHQNPLTNEYRCPVDGSVWKYISFYPTFHDRVYNVMPDGCNSSDCSISYTITDRINVTVYICADWYYGDPAIGAREGMIFGGIFETNNIFSDNGRCSFGFDEYPIFYDLTICLAPKFNPALNNLTYLTLQGVRLEGFAICPDNYHDCGGEQSTLYYITTYNNCPLYMCITIPIGNSFDTLPPLISRPPYISRDMAMSKTRISMQHEIDEAENNEDDVISTKDGKKIGTILNKFNF